MRLSLGTCLKESSNKPKERLTITLRLSNGEIVSIQ